MKRAKKEQLEITVRHSTYDDSTSGRPPWWTDADYHWSGKSARSIPPTLFGKR